MLDRDAKQVGFVGVSDLDAAQRFYGDVVGLPLEDAAGVVFRRYDGMDQDERGIWTAPGGARIAWFGDPDGNTLSLQAL